MNNDLNLVVMLTHNDTTLDNAYEILNNVKMLKSKFGDGTYLG